MAKRRPATSAPTQQPASKGPLGFRMLGAVWSLLVVVALLAAWWFWPREARLELAHAADQNVLLITIDTLRADALGSAGGAAATPNLDRVAREGIRYDFAHAHVPITLASHASILTGLYPFQHGVRENSGFRLAGSIPTLATTLKAKGFATGAFIGAYPLDSQFGLAAGFDVYDDQLNEVRGPVDFAFSERRADVVVEKALKWIAGQRGKWFAWVHVFDPHAPYRAPEPYLSRYASNPYAGEVAFTDAALAPLLDAARSAGGRPTLVVVTGDHGESLGEHGEDTHGVFAYEATLRIPLIVAQYRDGKPTAGDPPSSPRVSSLAVQHVDIVPTVLDLTEVAALQTLPGRSLASLTRADAAKRASYFEALTPYLNRGWAPLYGVLVDRQKFISLPITELYDLKADSGERTNRAEQAGDQRRLLESRLKEFGPTEPAAKRAETEETAERLRSLGYTGGTARRRDRYTEDDDPKRLVDLDADMQRGIVAFQEGRVAEAERIYTQVVTRRPTMGLGYLHLAFLQAQLGDVPRAIATLRTAREKVDASAEIDSRLGMYLSESGGAAEAIPLLEHAVTLPDAGVDALNALGIGYARAGRSGDAIATFRKVLAIDGRNAMAWQNIGSTHLSAGNLQGAREALRESIAVDPSWAASYTGLGVVEMRAGRRTDAIAAWKKAVELNPSDFDALFNLATELLNDRKTAEARPYLERFVASAPPAAYAKDIERLRAMLGR
jgi:arylsulfatase A-like enzyme/Flp pilus assembly protein TadD